jgi:hypothetical protein
MVSCMRLSFAVRGSERKAVEKGLAKAIPFEPSPVGMPNRANDCSVSGEETSSNVSSEEDPAIKNWAK